jgi:STE24 endopeptidase
VTRWAWIALVACAVGAVVTVLLTVPFPVLSGAHPHVEVLRDFTPAQLHREDAYHHAGRWTAYASIGVSVVVALALGLTRWGSRLVGGLPGHWTVRAVLGTALVIVLGRLATLPFDMQGERVLRRYGLSTQTWTSWTDDQLRGLGIAVVTTSLVVVAVLALARRFPTTWWISGGLLAATFTLVASFAYPIVIEPAFNHFTPLAAGQLRTDLLAMAARDGVPVKDVLVADASKRTTALNAYVSGFGSTRRIVLYDTLITTSPPKEVELVVAHELGHAKRQDVLHGTIIGAFGSGVAIIGLWLLLSWSGLLARIGASSAGDPRVVPFVLMLAVLTPLLLSPLTNLVTRHIEARADLHSLDLTGDLDTYVASEQRLSVVNLSDLDPGWFPYTLFFTHPSGPQRIALAREWKRLHP